MAKILRDKISKSNTEIKELVIKKDLIQEKIDMQKSFIADLDKSGKKRIADMKSKLDTLFEDESSLMGDNKKYDNLIRTKHQPEMDKLSNSRGSLKKMNTIKVKLEQRIQNITSDHKFFTDNVSCPTCLLYTSPSPRD